MTTNTKLTKVLEYLIKNDEEKARELLHQVFIEKARAIHEELMSMDEDAEEESAVAEEEMDESVDEEMDETVGGSGDMGRDLTNEIEVMDDEIEAEETMTMEDDDVDDFEMVAVGDEPADDEGEASFDSVEDKMNDFEAALSALKAEFEKLQASEEGEEAGEEEGGEEEQDESWELDEDFDDLAESLDLEVIERDVLKANKTAKDVGAASGGMTTGNDAKSPVPKSQTSRMGAGPVETGKGPTENGYSLKAAPKSADQGLGDNRRKKSTDGALKVSKEGDSSALINKATSDGFGAINTMSPLSKGGQNLK